MTKYSSPSVEIQFEHWNHVIGNWAYLLLPARPLMHLFYEHGGLDDGNRGDSEKR